MLITAYANGSTAGSPPPPSDHVRGKRGEVVGWSRSAVRRHTAWLYSVDSDRLSGLGFAITLTLGICPETHTDWRALLKRFFERMELAGAVRIHYVVEWQRRGVPHLHAALYFPAGSSELDIMCEVFVAWLAIAKEYGARLRAQDVKVIDGALGWLKYLSKHASRGVAHYQRHGKPESWTKTGQLWGHRGEWPTAEPMKFDIAGPTYVRFRRLVRAWRIADARAALVAAQAHPLADAEQQEKRLRAARRRVAYARRMLSCSDPRLSAVRGVSDWLPEHVTLGLIGLLWDQGHPVVQRGEEQDDA